MDGLGEAGEGGAVPLQGEPDKLGPGVVQELHGGEIDNMIIRFNVNKGASIKYVRTEGEGGRAPKSVRSKGGCVNSVL